MKRRQRWAWILVFFMVVCYFPTVTAKAKSVNLPFEHITTEDGLSHDTVYSIAQDRLGFLWFGSEDGLNRYDGYTIDIYRGGIGTHTIGNANCAVVLVDDQNRLWIASWGGGIIVLDPQTDEVMTYRNDPQNPDSLSDNSVHSIYQARNGTMWFGTYTQGLNRYNPQTQTFTRFINDPDDPNSLSHNRVWWIAEDSSGNLLVATNKGLDRFDITSETFTHVAGVTQRVRTIYRDKSGQLWLGTQAGLCTFNELTNAVSCFKHTTGDSSMDVITSLLEDSTGQFWVGTSNGLNWFDRTTHEYTRFEYEAANDQSLSNNDVRVIFEDASANLWVGTRGGGINKLNIKPRKFISFGNDVNQWFTLDDINVYGVFEDSEGILWVGTNNGGLNRLDFENKTHTVMLSDITQESNRDLMAFAETADTLWVGGLGGLNRIDRQSGTVKVYTHQTDDETSLSHSTILSLWTDAQDRLWVGTLGGLNHYDAQTDSFIRYPLSSSDPSTLSGDNITVIYGDQAGHLWIGTNTGLNRLIPETGQIKRFVSDRSNLTSLSDNIIHTIFEDHSGQLWVGTQYGLNHFNEETQTFTVMTMADGLPNNTIKAIQEDDQGRLWISTNRGLALMGTDRLIQQVYTPRDGLQGYGYNKNAATTTSKRLIYFGGTKGFDQIDPQHLISNTYIPPIVLTQVLVSNQLTAFTEFDGSTPVLRLPYTQRKLTVHFAAMDYTESDQNQFAYQLIGLDDEMIELGTSTTLNLTNLPHGNYTLKIIGSNADGVWNTEGTSIRLIVSPPWWLSNSAYTLYVLGGIGLFFGLLWIMRTRSERRYSRLNSRFNKTINMISAIGELRDPYTAGHQRRVAELACAIAKEMGLSEPDIDNLYLGSMIHDIGKINISSEILTKPGKLTELEYEILKTHVENGSRLMTSIDLPGEVNAIVAQHHERLDGSGYPAGLKGDEITLLSRIVMVADVVEAMTTDRPYRPALGLDMALDEILRLSDQRFDAKVVDACRTLFIQKGFRFSSE